MVSDQSIYAGLVLGLAVLLHALSRGLARRLQDPEAGFHPALARWFKPNAAGRMRELQWLHWSFIGLVWAAAVLLVLRALGWEDQSARLFVRLVDAGFDVGGFRVVPARILMGLVMAALMMGLARRLRAKLADEWLSRSGWDAATRESVATLLGYVAMIIAILAGLSVAGVKLTNLAIVAGALSVGIGFGLQNIVNNFVSGLILLSERPVRRGDYVRVGDVEGEVRKVHIRATEIETMDRVSVIVPNSQLISSPVLNWRLRDPFMRIVIQVGVAYGSDVELVRKILRELGEAHELTLPDGTPGVPDTHVHFAAFGDSSLNFELRTYIRDVNKRGSISSDLRFAIDKAFREHGITIPFPQRDVWMKSHVD